VSAIDPRGVYKRKYPSGEWMTSKQWFEDVKNPFTALSLLDFAADDVGLLLLHDGSQAFLRDGDDVEQILSLYDPWDEDYFVDDPLFHFRLVPHGPLAHAQRWRLAQQFLRPVIAEEGVGPGGSMPRAFGAVWCDAPGVAVTAFYRETEESGRGLDAYAGRGMEFPYVLRLVELNGEAATATVRLPGAVAAAFKTNLMGEIVEPLAAATADGPLPSSHDWSAVSITMRPREIATFYLDLVMGRKVPRNLDAHRHVWATVHRVGEGKK
jgi:alpha-mannosidase